MFKRAILAVCALTLLIAGCGDNLSDETVPPPASAGSGALTLVGATTCVDCHKDLPGDDRLTSDYLSGAHVIHSSHINAESPGYCLGCHDPLGDGEQLNSLIVPSPSLAAVSCEACHGLGSDHYGYGALPDNSPDYHVCGECHDALPSSHLTYHPEADNIYSDFSGSAHAASLDIGFDINLPKCNKCHTDEGARAYAGYNTVALLETAEPVVAQANPIQCRTCHDSHGTELLGANYNTVTTSDEYATCTNCHQRHDAEPETELIFHSTSWDKVITTTHYDDPTTDDAIEGYTMDTASERVCRDCHNVHSADITINQQWANSGHGGHIMAGKEDAAAERGDDDYRTLQDVANVKYNAVTEADAAALIHYNWDQTNYNFFTGDFPKGSCQRCHTSTGASNYLDDPSTYDSANNDFSHLTDWNQTTGSPQNEMIYCWACHANNTGAMREPGAIIPDYNSLTLTVHFPDVGNSNVCVACHGGRGNYETITTGRSFRSSSHHLPAAAMMFSEETRMGYEYAGLDYSDPGQFMHKYISRSFDDPDSGRGPCVTCHMGIDADHTFAVVEKEDATITTNVNKGVCDACHTGSFEMTPEFLESRSEQFASAKQLLADYVGNVIPNYNTMVIDHTIGDEEDYGAFQNNLIVHEEHGAYAHNRTYAKRLIFDSVDWLDSGSLEGMISIDTATYSEAATWLGWDGSGTNYNAVRP